MPTKLDYDLIWSEYQKLGNNAKAVSQKLSIPYPSIRQVVRYKQGKCYCGKNRESESFYCPECKANHRLWKRNRRAKRREANICQNCDRQTSESSTEFCDEHLVQSRSKKLKWASENPEKRQGYYNRTRYGGLRPSILARDKMQCIACLRSDRTLHVHHRDHDNTNNTLENLVTLCVVCHATVTRLLELDHGSRIRLLSTLP